MATVTHKVVKGDTLWAISRKYGTTVEAIAKLNNIKNVNLIYVGQVLTISGQSSTEVVNGGSSSSPSPSPSPPSSTITVKQTQTQTTINNAIKKASSSNYIIETKNGKIVSVDKKAKYTLTKTGYALKDVFEAAKKWGQMYSEKLL